MDGNLSTSGAISVPAPLGRDNLLAALPPFVMAVCFWMVLGPGLRPIGVDGISLQNLLSVEFLVIHSFAILCAFGLGVNKDAPLWRKVLFGALGVTYIGLGFKLGSGSILAFLLATVATYLGFWFQKRDPEARVLLGIRWGMTTLAYMASILFCEEFNAGPMTRGFFFFMTLAGLEAAGFFRAGWWEHTFRWGRLLFIKVPTPEENPEGLEVDLSPARFTPESAGLDRRRLVVFAVWMLLCLLAWNLSHG